MLNYNFYYNINYKSNKGYSYTKYKLKYDNNIIKKKMNEIKNKSGPYNIRTLRPNNESGIKETKYNNIKKLENIIKNENDKKFLKRIKSAKGNYNIKKMEKSNKKLNDYRKFYLEILRKNRECPFIYYEMQNILN